MSEPFRTIGTSIASFCPAFERARCPSTESAPSLAPGGEGCRHPGPKKESIEMWDWIGRERNSVHQQDLVDPEAQFGGLGNWDFDWWVQFETFFRRRFEDIICSSTHTCTADLPTSALSRHWPVASAVTQIDRMTLVSSDFNIQLFPTTFSYISKI